MTASAADGVPERPCPLCGAGGVRPVLETAARSAQGAPYRVVACTDCGLRYTRPLPTPDEFLALYPTDYHVRNSPRLWSRDFARVLLERWVMSERRRCIAGIPPGRVLDVGCGNGAFLASLRDHGWDVQGTDTSATACELTRAKGVPAHHGELRGAGFPAASFDVVTLFHVLEHLPEPLAELVEVRRVLRPEGRLVVHVPDNDSVTLRLCGARWLPLDVPRHLQHYTHESLRQTLARAGFTIVRERRGQPTDVAASFYSFLRCPLPPERGHIRYYAKDYKSASLAARVRFLAVGLPVLAGCLLYTPGIRALTGHCETLTATCRPESL